MRPDYTANRAEGISSAHRELLSRLHRAFPGPFDAEKSASVLYASRRRTAQLLCYWAARGWLSRIQRGTYITVPLAALKPSEWKEDAWVMADVLFAPCYIGGWSAAEHWGLTARIFNDVVVFTALRPRRRRQTIKGVKYLLTTVSKQALWGLSPVWRRNVKIAVSGPERTIADILDNPALGGGIKHAAEIVQAYFDGECRDDRALVQCLRRTTNRTVCKRLGFMLEILKRDAPTVVKFCASRVSAGYSRLDPAIRAQGRLLRKWNLDVNVELGPRNATA